MPIRVTVLAFDLSALYYRSPYSSLASKYSGKEGACQSNSITSQWGGFYPHDDIYTPEIGHCHSVCTLCPAIMLLLEEITFPLGHTVYFYIIISERTLAVLWQIGATEEKERRRTTL
jgi:hypothetical protein